MPLLPLLFATLLCCTLLYSVILYHTDGTDLRSEKDSVKGNTIESRYRSSKTLREISSLFCAKYIYLTSVNLLIFNSFCPLTIPYFTCLTGFLSFPSTPDRMHSQVRTWTKNVDIFEKDFVIVPINERYVLRNWSEYYILS